MLSAEPSVQEHRLRTFKAGLGSTVMNLSVKVMAVIERLPCHFITPQLSVRPRISVRDR